LTGIAVSLLDGLSGFYKNAYAAIRAAITAKIGYVRYTSPISE
jgi:hypothetical protein